MAAERIGRARCPLCQSDRARLSLAKSGLSCLTCDACNAQVFARSGTSDDHLRARHIPDAAPAPAPTTTTEPAPAPAAPAVQQQDAPRRPAWGFMGATA
ncbi:MAG: hypothetical protein KBC73_05480 [Burkholderiaceae bacterium]|nr:hypothetical protein [Burkholderiaceae bacterium]